MADEGSEFSDSPQRQTYLQFMFSAIRGDREGAIRCIDLEKFAAFIPGHYRVVFDELLELFANVRAVAPDFGAERRFLGSLEQPGELCVQYRSSYLIANPHPEMVTYTACDWVKFDEAGNMIELRMIYTLNDDRQRAFGMP